MLCAVDYNFFNFFCAFNCLQPMKKFVFSVASRATGRLQIKPSGSVGTRMAYALVKTRIKADSQRDFSWNNAARWNSFQWPLFESRRSKVFHI